MSGCDLFLSFIVCHITLRIKHASFRRPKNRRVFFLIRTMASATVNKGTRLHLRAVISLYANTFPKQNSVKT